MDFNAFELNIKARTKCGSTNAKALLNAGLVPVVIYNKTRNLCGYIEESILQKALLSRTLFNKLTVVNFEQNNKIEKITVCAKIVQKESVHDKILHIDFQLIEKGQNVKMRIPINFVNQDLCQAIKLGGIFNVVCRHVELKGKIEEIPAFLQHDLTKAEVKISIKMSDFVIPAGVKCLTSENQVIATILAAKKKEESVVEAQDNKSVAN